MRIQMCRTRGTTAVSSVSMATISIPVFSIPVFSIPVFALPVFAVPVMWSLLVAASAGSLYAQSGAEVPRLLEVEAQGADLKVSFFRGSPAPGAGSLDVVVTGAGCGEIARVPSSTSGSSEVVVALAVGVLDDVLSCGTSYRVTLEGSSGPVGEDLPFLLGVTCNASLQCNLTVSSWADAQGALVASPQLDQALAGAAGGGDLVGMVSSQSPQLRDEMLSHALRLDRLLATQGNGWTGGCHCLWTGLVERPPAMGGVDGPVLSARICPETLSAQVDGTLSVRTVNRCYSLGSGQGSTLFLPAGQVVTIPAFDACSGSGTNTPGPVVSGFRLTFDGEVQAGGDLGHFAQASLAVGFAFGGQLFMSGSAAAVRSSSDPQASEFDTLYMDSGILGADRASLSANGQVDLLPSSSSPVPQLRGRVEGAGAIEAWYSNFYIEIRAPGSGTDTFVDGGDIVSCSGDGGNGD